MTYQGLWRRLAETARNDGHEVFIHDKTEKLPKPLYRAMFGFRFSQHALLVTALMQEISGLIGAPTRYGKTTLLINAARAFPTLPTVITAPGVDLVRQTYEAAKVMLPGRDVRWLKNAKSKQGDVTICSIDSLHHCNHGRTRLLLIDEPHATASDSRIVQIKEFPNARRLGFGATLQGRFDRRDMVIEGLIGPVLANRTYREAVAEGAICPITVVQCVLKFDPWHVFQRDAVMRHLLWESQRVADLARLISDTLPREWQTLLFIKNEKQAEFFHERLRNAEIPIAMAKRMTAKARKELTHEIAGGVHNRVICSDIYVQGVTFSDIRALVNLSGGGPYTSAVQKPGRLAEIRPEIGKRRGYLFDVTFEPSFLPDSSVMQGQAWRGIMLEGERRIGVYKDIGYDIVRVQNHRELKDIIRQFVNE